MKKILLAFGLLFTVANTFAQTELPHILDKDGRHCLMVDGKPYLILGGQAHNSSGWPAMLPKVWEAAATMHLNTVEVPVYWEQIEDQPGQYDFSVVDTLLAGARTHNVRLVLLWFGTWKNGSNHYMPGWMKRDAAKYPNITGKNGQPIDSPSPYSAPALQADTKAFITLMTHLKEQDAQHTVIMVQVENETGSWGSVRDYAPTAQKLFEGQVPAALLKPEILKALNRPVVSSGAWAQVFGDRADEYFQAWSVASYVGQVAAAGKSVYPLPLYVNAALRDPLTDPPATNYESGGPTDNVFPIWKAAAPAIDLLAPDIYLDGTERILKVIDLYTRPNNTLFVPEAALSADKVKYLYPVLAHGGIGFSPFGIDDTGHANHADRLAPFAAEYAMAAPMAAELAQWAFEGKIQAVVEPDDHSAQTINLGRWQAVVNFGAAGPGRMMPNEKPTGKLMVIKLSDDQFLVTGTLCRLTFKPLGDNKATAWEYLKVEEGAYENGVFKARRILNGDETDWGGPAFGTSPVVLRVSLVGR